MTRKLEICCGDLLSVANAVAGGADRIELCSGLAEGGVTPSEGFIRGAGRLKGEHTRLHVLIRPRGGDFCYDEADREAIINDVAACAASPYVDGIVIGALTPEAEIDLDLCRRCIEVAGGKSLTFHRAFDLCRDPLKALEEIIDMGFDRILTSGCGATAMEGAEMLNRLNKAAAGRIIILGASGVSSSNASDLLDATGLSELHASARRPVASQMKWRHEGVAMGAPGSDEYSRMVTSEEEVKTLRDILDTYKK